MRKDRVTAEHIAIAPHLLGKALASPVRRGLALAVDLLVCIIIGLPWLLLVTAASIHWQAPHVLPKLWEHRSHLFASPPESSEGKPASAQELFYREAGIDLAEIVAKNKPQALPGDVHQALQSGDVDEFLQAVDRYRLKLVLQLSVNPEDSHFDPETNTIYLRQDAFLGTLASFLGWASLLLAYFTLLLWRMEGRTLGKLLFGVRVVRLDGKRLTLWNGFERAGGYGASLSTLGLGFIDAFIHPNRQTVHDRICGTVVLSARQPARQKETDNADAEQA